MSHTTNLKGEGVSVMVCVCGFVRVCGTVSVLTYVRACALNTFFI